MMTSRPSTKSKMREKKTTEIDEDVIVPALEESSVSQGDGSTSLETGEAAAHKEISSNFTLEESFAMTSSTASSSRLASATTGSHSNSFNSSTNFRGSFQANANSYSPSRRQSRKSSVTALRPQARRSNDLSDMTIDKLNYSAIQKKLYGRDKEVELLQTKLEEMMTDNSNTSAPRCTRQLVLLHGYSGAGKTALAMVLQKELQGRQRKYPNGLLVQGKFDLNLRNTPYCGIADACSRICGAILERQQRQPTNVGDSLQDALLSLGQDNLHLLIRVIPALREVVPVQDEAADDERLDNEETSPESQSPAASDSWNRFLYTFVQFIQVVSTHMSPLVLVLDDLQWSDMASLELLQTLLTHTTSSAIDPMKIMIIGTYRSNEVDDTHIFHRVKDDLLSRAKTSSSSFEITKMEIGNLSRQSVQELLCDILAWSHVDNGDSDDEEIGTRRISQLADICVEKTYGNVFYLLHFLSMLHETKQLKFNFAIMTWQWNAETILSNSSASDNVIDLLQTKMTSQLSKDLVYILRLAGCLGSSFEERMLRLVWEQSSNRGDVAERREQWLAPSDDSDRLEDTDELAEGLHQLVADGYLRERSSTGGKSYSWAHDKIHEAAMSLTPSHAQFSFLRSVGQLVLNSCPDDLDSYLFIVVNLLNHNDASGDEAKLANAIQGESDAFRLQLAQLNFRATQKAVESSAFDSAAEYAALGIQWLPENAWAEHYRLTLSLFTLGAKCEGYLGRVETMEKYCNTVIELECPLDDKLDIYIILIDSIANRAKYEEAKDVIVQLLKQFKCNFPESKAMIGLQVISQLAIIKATLKSRTVKSLQPMKDATKVRLMKILDQFALYCYLSKDERMPLIFFRSLNWTLKVGFCEWSPTAFATSGVILIGAFDDLQGALRYAQLALELNDKLQTDSTKARLYLTAYAFIHVWVFPIKDMLKPMLDAYDVGLRTGDTESATWCIFHWIILKMMVGTSLEALEADSMMYTKQMFDLKRDMAGEFLTYIRQVFLNLLGKDNAKNPTNITGTVLSEEALERHQRDPFHSAGIQAYHGILLTYFGEHIRRADWIIESGHDYLQKAMVASINTMFDTFFSGVSCFAAARETGKKRYARIGAVLRAKVKKWAVSGNPNVNHYLAFLDAEALALHGRKHSDLVLKKFELAIKISTRGGYQHDAAFANERLGEYMLCVLNEQDDATYYIERAVNHWQEWGAAAKVIHIREKYRKILPNPPGMIVVST